MKLSLVVSLLPTTAIAFQAASVCRTPTSLAGYLDDLSGDLYGADPDPDVKAMSREETQMNKEQIDRFGPGNFQEFVDFNEFDGGDGRK